MSISKTKFSLNIASCIPDCNGNEDSSPRSRRAVNRRELPFVSLGHDVYAELPIQRKPEFNGDEIFIIDERSSDIGGKLFFNSRSI